MSSGPQATAGPVYNLWPGFRIPAHESAILTQTAYMNFDTSDHTIVGCGGTVSPNDPRIPKISVTVGGVTQAFLDTAHILDTFGYDLACKGNESLQWRPVGSEGTARTGAITLLPPATTLPVGGLATLTAAVTDAGGAPVAGVTVDFRVVSGPNTGATGSAVTDASGLAEYPATSSVTGLDTVVARVTNSSGGTLSSPTATILWLPAVDLNLSPPTSTQPVGTPYDATLLATDPSGQPVPDLDIRFRVASGPNAGLTGVGTTDATGQAVFVYTSGQAGTDSVVAEVALAGGAVQASNTVSTTWTAPRTLTLEPVSQSHPVGSEADFVATLRQGTEAVAGETVTLAATSGPDAGTTEDATTDASGEAHFALVGQAAGTDLLEARAGSGADALVSEPVSATWTAIPTALAVTAPPVAEWNDPLTVSALLTVAATGEPLAGQTIELTLGTETAQATTGADGVATVSFLPRDLPGAVSLVASFAGAPPYLPAASARLLTIERDETVLTLTGGAAGGSTGVGAIAAGSAEEVSARLTDGEDGRAARRQDDHLHRGGRLRLGGDRLRRRRPGVPDASGERLGAAEARRGLRRRRDRAAVGGDGRGGRLPAGVLRPLGWQPRGARPGSAGAVLGGAVGPAGHGWGLPGGGRLQGVREHRPLARGDVRGGALDDEPAASRRGLLDVQDRGELLAAGDGGPVSRAPRRDLRRTASSGQAAFGVVRTLLALFAMICILLIGWLLYYIAGPGIDNWLGIKTARDLQILKSYPVDGRALGSLVTAAFPNGHWRAYHEDWIFATRVDYSAVSPSGEQLLLSWEVRHGFPPRDWMPKRDLYITPLSRDAAELIPQLLPPGVRPQDLPLSRFYAGVVYDIARYKNR